MSFNVPGWRRFDRPDKQNRKVLQGGQNVGEQNRIKGVSSAKRSPDCGFVNPVGGACPGRSANRLLGDVLAFL
jgi:hypothetical protein